MAIKISMWQLYKYQPVNKLVLSNLSQLKLWASKPAAFNDPFEFRLQRKKVAKGLETLREQNPQLSGLSDEKLIKLAIEKYEQEIRSMGVVCFTELPNSIQMWSYYADSHKGICIGFCGIDKDKSKNDSALYKVSYESDYPELTFSDIWHRDGLAKILWTKEKEWEHEKEWRQIKIEGDKLCEYTGYKLNKIIFGLRTSEIDKNLVRSVVPEEVEFLQVKRHDTSYNLELVPTT